MTLWHRRVISHHQQHATDSGCGFACPSSPLPSFLCDAAAALISLPGGCGDSFHSTCVCLSVKPKTQFLRGGKHLPQWVLLSWQWEGQETENGTRHDEDEEERVSAATVAGASVVCFLFRVSCFGLPSSLPSFLPPFLWFRVVPAALQTHFSLGSAQNGEHETRVR